MESKLVGGEHVFSLVLLHDPHIISIVLLKQSAYLRQIQVMTTIVKIGLISFVFKVVV